MAQAAVHMQQQQQQQMQQQRASHAAAAAHAAGMVRPHSGHPGAPYMPHHLGMVMQHHHAQAQQMQRAMAARHPPFAPGMHAGVHVNGAPTGALPGHHPEAAAAMRAHQHAMMQHHMQAQAQAQQRAMQAMQSAAQGIVPPGALVGGAMDEYYCIACDTSKPRKMYKLPWKCVRVEWVGAGEAPPELHVCCACYKWASRHFNPTGQSGHRSCAEVPSSKCKRRLEAMSEAGWVLTKCNRTEKDRVLHQAQMEALAAAAAAAATRNGGTRSNGASASGGAAPASQRRDSIDAVSQAMTGVSAPNMMPGRSRAAAAAAPPIMRMSTMSMPLPAAPPMPPQMANMAATRPRASSGAAEEARLAAASSNGAGVAPFAAGVAPHSSGDGGASGGRAANGGWARPAPTVSLLPDAASNEVPGVDSASLLAAIRARSSGVSDMQRRVHERNVLYLAQCVAYATTNASFAADMAGTVKKLGTHGHAGADGKLGHGAGHGNGAGNDHGDRKARGSSVSGADSAANGEAGSQSTTPNASTGRHLCPCCSKMQKDARLKYFYGATVRVCETCKQRFRRLVQSGATPSMQLSARDSGLFLFMDAATVGKRGRAAFQSGAESAAQDLLGLAAVAADSSAAQASGPRTKRRRRRRNSDAVSEFSSSEDDDASSYRTRSPKRAARGSGGGSSKRAGVPK